MASNKTKNAEYQALLAGFNATFEDHSFANEAERRLALRAYQYGAVNHLLYVMDQTTALTIELARQGKPQQDISKSIAQMVNGIVSSLAA